ncbi:MAG TPA: hypothetical protein VGN07_16335 [Steroidobacteraceae bacterium]|jgi:hypothetical protein
MKHRSIATAVVSVALMGWMTAGFTADPPAKVEPPAKFKECKSATGDARKECDKVAAKMQESKMKDPGEGEQINRPDVQHSSPIMTDDKEKAEEAAHRKGKDPRKAVEKLEQKDQAPAKQPPQ